MNAQAAKPRFRHRLTRLGVHFLFIALFAMLGGSLRGFNLLLVLAGLLVGILLIQWRIGRANIRGARLQRLPSTGVHASAPLTLRYQITNPSRWLPLWMMRIHDQVSTSGDIGILPESESLTQASFTHSTPADVISSVGHVGQSRASRTSVVCRFNHRGCYRLGPMHLSSSFPFSLVQSDQLPNLETDSIYVYPRLLDLRKGWRSLLQPRQGGDGQRSTGGIHQDGDFFGLRRWQSGDQVKQVHWRTTARVGEPLVRQFEQRNQHQVCVLVDGRSVSSHDAFERALEWAATVLKELFEQKQTVTLLVADRDADSEVLPAVSMESSRDLNPLLRRLAIASAETCRVDQIDTPRADTVLADTVLADTVLADTVLADTVLADTVLKAKARFRHNDLVIISTRSMRQAIAKPVDHHAHGVLRQLKRTGRLTWIDVNAPAVKHCVLPRPNRDVRRGVGKSIQGETERGETERGETERGVASADETGGLSHAGR